MYLQALKYRLVAFDLDGTLTKGEGSWWMLHRRFGTLERSIELDCLYSQGKISYRQYMLMDLSMWPKPLARSMLQEVLLKYQLREEAKDVVDNLKRAGIKTAVVTAALDIIAEDLCKKLGIEYCMCNKIGFDANDIYNGSVYPLVDPKNKHLALQKLSKETGVKLNSVLAVGDSDYDTTFLKSAGKGLLIGNEILAKQIGIEAIPNLSAVLSYL